MLSHAYTLGHAICKMEILTQYSLSYLLPLLLYIIFPLTLWYKHGHLPKKPVYLFVSKNMQLPAHNTMVVTDGCQDTTWLLRLA